MTCSPPAALRCVASSKERLKAVDAFIGEHYEFRRRNEYKGFRGRIKAFFDKHEAENNERLETGALDLSRPEKIFKAAVHGSDPWSYADALRRLRERELQELPLENSFSVALMELIEAKGKNAVEVYKRAQLDRKLFSKIRRRSHYVPSKRTIIALALALELSLDETGDLLKRAGFALSRSILFDVIIEYFISRNQYDLFEINDVLAAYKQPLLGCE